jgi:hypothetical protein
MRNVSRPGEYFFIILDFTPRHAHSLPPLADPPARNFSPLLKNTALITPWAAERAWILGKVRWNEAAAHTASLIHARAVREMLLH